MRFLVAAALVVASCSNAVEAQEEDISTPEALVRSVLSAPAKDESSGLVDHTIEGRRLRITYQHWPVGWIDYSREASRTLAPVFKALFKKADHFDHVFITVRTPWDVPTGGIAYHDTLHVVMERPEYDQIDWEKFDSKNLLTVATGVEWIRNR